ncbi:MAG TPA: type II toxin-antitoxin system VapC family toxin [Verrucomicrobiae bacterium]|jgi:predicted nucleic acid-binding protein
MIADTTFLSDFLKEFRTQSAGPARTFLAEHRSSAIRTTVISAAEFAVMFSNSDEAWKWLSKWKIYPLNTGIAKAASDIDRLLKSEGHRLGENDTWIAGFAAYYREPLISHDVAFDRAPGVRRIIYQRD